MATQHDSHDTGSGFWGCANWAFGLGFAICALAAGGALFVGGIGKGREAWVDPAVAAAAAAPAPPAEDPNTLVVTLRPAPANPMMFETTIITAKAGQKVKLTFENLHPTGPLQHNFILGKIGSKQKLIDASNGMMTEMAKWMAAGFIPEIPEVLAHTKLLNPGQSETIEFTLPAEKGEYPYLCTFPGHALIMQGTLKAE